MKKASKSKVKIPFVDLGDQKFLVPHYIHGLDTKSLPDTLGMGFLKSEARAIPWHGDKQIPVSWLEAPVVHGMLEVVGYHGGRSSSCYEVEISRIPEVSCAASTKDLLDGLEIRKVSGLMSCSSFRAIIPYITLGVTTGLDFKIVKLGQNYLIQPALEE